MRNTYSENLSMHTQETATIAHCLAVINNVYFSGNANAERTAVLALFHDCAEIFTGDMPTPVKYSGEKMKKAYEEIEIEAEKGLLERLPVEMKDVYEPLIVGENSLEFRLMKQADKLCAYIKCIEERNAGNKEFLRAEKTIKNELQKNAMPETKYFMEHFVSAYELTLDETEKA